MAKRKTVSLEQETEWKKEELERAEELMERAMKGEDTRLRPGRSIRDLDKDILKLRRELKKLQERSEGRKH